MSHNPAVLGGTAMSGLLPWALRWMVSSVEDAAAPAVSSATDSPRAARAPCSSASRSSAGSALIAKPLAWVVAETRPARCCCTCASS